MKKYAGEEFLNKIYKDLYKSDIVKHTAIGSNKNEDVSIYMDRLDRVTNKAIEHNHLNTLKRLYYDKYVIKPENVLDSYFELQKKIALERGYGRVIYNKQQKEEEIEHLISEQKASLDTWIDYFFSSEANIYPMWFKYYCFQGMIKLGYLDKKNHKFTKRTKSTVKPFVELNQEAIGMIYDELIKILDKKEIDDEELEQLLKGGSFKKIYAYMLAKLDSLEKDNTDTNEGIWKKYNQGSDPKILYNDIHGKGTGWCTAGGIEMSKRHLDGGDFHVFYTKNAVGEFVNPRIAIRMEGSNIAEIRGIRENQNIEPCMEEVVSSKLKEFPDGDLYRKKVNDMEQLTDIHTRWKNKEELTKSDLRFLYEIDDKILSFGYNRDPRIFEILCTRDVRRDVSKVLNCKEENISLTKREALSGNIVYHYGNLDLSEYTEIDYLKLPLIVSGDVYLVNLVKVRHLDLPLINGSLGLDSLIENLEYLNLTPEVRGSVDMFKMVELKNVVLPKKIGTVLVLPRVVKLENVDIDENLNCELYSFEFNDDLGLFKKTANIGKKFCK